MEGQERYVNGLDDSLLWRRSPMVKKTHEQMTLAQMRKALMTAIRLKHTMAADEEINELVPELEEQYNRALASGKPLSSMLHRSSTRWSEMRVRSEPRRVWCFDIEVQAGPYGGGDFNYRNLLSMAGAFEGEKAITYLAPGFTPTELEEFVTPIRNGALIVCHNGPRFDLPVLSGTLQKNGLPPLPTVLIHDTYACLYKRGAAYSASLGNMTERFTVGASKGHMGEVMWERAYAGDPVALKKLRTHNEGDVRTTLALR
jgi:uncharacterized protein YprB with RNaseH-like and TPR domain